MTVPGGMFVPGGRTGIAKAGGIRPLVPKAWLKAHPLTRLWNGAATYNAPAVTATTLAIDLNDGFEGLIEWMVLRDGANFQTGNSSATGWAILINDVPVVQTAWTTNNGASPIGTDTAGRYDVLHALDGVGSSWGNLDCPIEENGRVSVRVEAGNGLANIGWSLWGIYWPISLRGEWLSRGWRK